MSKDEDDDWHRRAALDRFEKYGRRSVDVAKYHIDEDDKKVKLMFGKGREKLMGPADGPGGGRPPRDVDRDAADIVRANQEWRGKPENQAALERVYDKRAGAAEPANPDKPERFQNGPDGEELLKTSAARGGAWDKLSETQKAERTREIGREMDRWRDRPDSDYLRKLRRPSDAPQSRVADVGTPAEKLADRMQSKLERWWKEAGRDQVKGTVDWAGKGMISTYDVIVQEAFKKKQG